jgi:16S rRNA (cytosine967-C5)-methyltransferase
VLVYATCTVHPAENDELVDAFLAAHPAWNQQGRQQWWPAEGQGDGFFVARLLAPSA